MRFEILQTRRLGVSTSFPNAWLSASRASIATGSSPTRADDIAAAGLAPSAWPRVFLDHRLQHRHREGDARRLDRCRSIAAKNPASGLAMVAGVLASSVERSRGVRPPRAQADAGSALAQIADGRKGRTYVEDASCRNATTAGPPRSGRQDAPTSRVQGIDRQGRFRDERKRCERQGRFPTVGGGDLAEPSTDASAASLPQAWMPKPWPRCAQSGLRHTCGFY